jgi:Holliday junction resolvase-like predicted endonuclease
MNDVSAAHADAVERAARALKEKGLQVLDQGWGGGEHRLDLVASPGSDILAAVEVAVAPPCPLGVSVATLTEARFWKATDALREWIRQHGPAAYNDLWVVLVTVDPNNGCEAVTANAAGVS